MKSITILLLVIMSLINGLHAQNVGIGTNIPAEKLDVNGNVNVQGNVKVNGVSGTDGQVLMTNNAGATVWSDLCDFKNIASFTQNTTWTIPAGVTKIMIEAWGGGGGGAAGGGGAGAAYIRSQVVNVSPGNLTITIGTGGAGAATQASNAANGTPTIISGAFGTYTANEGGGGFPSNGGIAIVTALIGNSYIMYSGQSGYTNTISYGERTAGQFVEIKRYGAGGGSYPFYNAGGNGGATVKDLNSALIIEIGYPSIFNKTPGIGGGGGLDSGGLWGASGAKGMVIIHY